MRTFNLTVIFIFLTATVSFAQNCDCVSNFEWVKKTFEENDAGFQYIVDKKGHAAYDIHNQLMLEKIKAAKTSTECPKLFYEWLKFFRSGHIGIELLTQKEPDISQTPKENAVYETFKVDIPKFEKYISTKKEVDYEGIWDLGYYKIGIQKNGVNYIGFIIETEVDTWKSKQVKLKIEQNGDEVKSTFYMRDHSAEESGNPELIGNNILQIGGRILERLSPIFPDDPFIENYFKAMSAEKPYLETLNETTLYLRIPSFYISEKPAIDSVLSANKDIILKTENLIIDLRNNGGGSDESYKELLPFLYTNPIRTPSIEFLSTPHNTQQMLDYSTNTDFGEDTRMWIKDLYDKLKDKLGEFVPLHDEPVYIERQDTVYEYPKNVGVIINKGNASTTEQFLFAAKQSKKVKLFGVTTHGALDISNMLSIESPCKEFELWYCMSRSMRIPDMTIDDIGIQPDYYLDKTIPEHKWVKFVNEVLNGQK